MTKLNITLIAALLLGVIQGNEVPEMMGGSKKFLQDTGFGRQRWAFESGKNGSTLNNRPIIGVLTQPLTEAFKKDPRFANKTSYIMASYINILESAGARTVPLIFDGDLQTELAKLG